MWMVLALLTMGLGCSEEPPEPWPSASRTLFMDECLEDFEENPLIALMAAADDITPRDACRCTLYGLERLYTWSDLDRRFSDEEVDASLDEVIAACYDEMVN